MKKITQDWLHVFLALSMMSFDHRGYIACSQPTVDKCLLFRSEDTYLPTVRVGLARAVQ
mgnify:CR=1 FL=1